MAETTLIERREYKYLVDQETANGLRAAIRPYCQLDDHAARSPDRTYTIDTLYFDNADLGLFWANDHEQVDRIKMRIRGYPDAPKAPVFLEVKRRINDVISKSRGKLSRDEWAALLANPCAPLPAHLRGKDKAAVERFLTLAGELHIKPVTLVRYKREPYFSTIDDYARVTFDTNIRAQRMERLSFDADPRAWRSLDDAVLQRSTTGHSLTVLELKFTSQVPL